MKKGSLRKMPSAIFADLEEFNLPEKIVLRADGTSIYVTQDIYLAKMKFDQYPLDRSIYVIGSEHNLYVKQLFAILKKLGFEFADKCYHKAMAWFIFLKEK
jgi:arginyl-tRNA synthetase